MKKFVKTLFYTFFTLLTFAQKANKAYSPLSGGCIGKMINITPSDSWFCNSTSSLIFVTSAWNYERLQWQKSSDSGHTWQDYGSLKTYYNYSGFARDTIIVDSLSASIGYQYRVRWEATGCPQYFSPPASIIPFSENTALWTGYAADQNWHNPNNWLCDIIPNDSTNVIIDSYGEINLNASTTIKTLSIKNIGIFNVAEGVNLTILH